MIDRILVNDIIIIDKNKSGCSYTTLDQWFKSYRLSAYNYGKSLPNHIRNDNIDEEYRCTWIAPHPKTGEMLYAIEGMDTKKVFLINKNAILKYSHTCGSHDNTELALKILSSEYYDLDSAFEKFKSSIKKQNTVADDSNDMPKLEEGMFGIAKCLKTNKIFAFYVTEDTIIYESGGWDSHSIFDKTGKSTWIQILALYNSDAKSFTGATAIYVNNPDSSKTIWKKKD